MFHNVCDDIVICFLGSKMRRYDVVPACSMRPATIYILVDVSTSWSNHNLANGRPGIQKRLQLFTGNHDSMRLETRDNDVLMK